MRPVLAPGTNWGDCNVDIAAPAAPVQAQARTGAAAMLSALSGAAAGMVPLGKPTGDPIDRRSPQHFQDHPRLQDVLNASAVGDDTSRESLPGRVGPSAWDGEPGWLAAIGGGG